MTRTQKKFVNDLDKYLEDSKKGIKERSENKIDIGEYFKKVKNDKIYLTPQELIRGMKAQSHKLTMFGYEVELIK